MAKKSAKKVRSVEVEKVKNGEGGHLHKVTARFHHSTGKSGKGFSDSIGRYQDPEETFHTSHAKAKKKVHEHMRNMTATPEEEIRPDTGPKETASAPPGGSHDGETGEEDTE